MTLVLLFALFALAYYLFARRFFTPTRGGRHYPAGWSGHDSSTHLRDDDSWPHHNVVNSPSRHADALDYGHTAAGSYAAGSGYADAGGGTHAGGASDFGGFGGGGDFGDAGAGGDFGGGDSSSYGDGGSSSYSDSGSSSSDSGGGSYSSSE